MAKALQRLSHDTGSGKRHASALALCEEAVAAARSIDPAEPARADVLYDALNTCQRELYTVGRRADGLTMRAEMLAISRAQAELSGDPLVKGLHEWAAGLSEEGSFWAVLLTFSGAGSDRPAPDGPRPPSGAAPMQRSPDVRQRYFDSRHALREEVDALAPRAAEDPDQHLAELVRLHRVLTIRSAG
ncbi:hypothetical protein [Streptomyces sp. KS 21]|uniref:hypothetical protein n=1 Tax=Streptomyces sp. KS 21 TaxID=2485150 RepID=UPI001FB86FD3|nr:hypothetical protein [Streptomyces sp. KS 21]